MFHNSLVHRKIILVLQLPVNEWSLIGFPASDVSFAFVVRVSPLPTFFLYIKMTRDCVVRTHWEP